MKVKKTFQYILVIFACVLVVLPFSTAFNEVLTRFVENISAYKYIQRLFVPYMSNLVAGVLRFLPGLEIGTYPYGVVINGVDVRITWNCLGWQGFLLFGVSLVVGLRGNYNRVSKLQAVIFGFLGTFIINITRLVFTAALVGWWRGLFVILFHNYFSTFITIAWLIFYWWFSYSYILEERVAKEAN